MSSQEILVISTDDDLILLFNLIGLSSHLLARAEDFLKEFNKIIKNSSIGMIIIAIELPSDVIDYLIDFKLHNRRPFIYYLPDIFQSEVEKNNVFLNKIIESVSKIIR